MGKVISRHYLASFKKSLQNHPELKDNLLFQDIIKQKLAKTTDIHPATADQLKVILSNPTKCSYFIRYINKQFTDEKLCSMSITKDIKLISQTHDSKSLETVVEYHLSTNELIKFGSKTHLTPFLRPTSLTLNHVSRSRIISGADT